MGPFSLAFYRCARLNSKAPVPVRPRPTTHGVSITLLEIARIDFISCKAALFMLTSEDSDVQPARLVF